jgi:hypothetical protein
MLPYVIPESCENIVYSIVSSKRDAFRDASSICKTRVTSITVMDSSYGESLEGASSQYFYLHKNSFEKTVENLDVTTGLRTVTP